MNEPIVIPQALIEKQRRERSRRQEPVARLQAFGELDRTVDRDSVVFPLFVMAFDAQGQPAVGHAVRFAVKDSANPTGTAFIVAGIPVEDSYGLTDGSGAVMPTDTLLSGMTPGTAVVRVTAPESAGDDVHADFTIRVSDATPTAINILSGGNESFTAGTAVVIAATVQLVDKVGKPITFGTVRFHIDDPNGTHSQLTYAGNPVVWIEEAVNSEGIAAFTHLVGVGEGAPGASFVIRASRNGREPHGDLVYQTLAPGAE